MKFVSESLADKIAGFIAQAAQHMINHASEEIHRDVSEENKGYNIKQVSSEREYQRSKHNIKRKGKNGQPIDYRKDELFSHLEGASKYAEDKKPPIQYSYPLIQEENVFKSNANAKEDIKFKNFVDSYQRTNVLSEEPPYKNNEVDAKEDESSSSDSDLIEGNELQEGEVKNKNADTVRFRAEEEEPVEDKKHVQLVATSGDLILTKIPTVKPDEVKVEEKEEKSEKKQEKAGEAWF